MKISILQTKPKLGDFFANRDNIRRMVDNAMETRPDAILLPELWDVGCYPQPIEEYADPNGDKIRQFLSNLAAKYQINLIGGSAAILVNDRVLNTSYTFDRTGRLIASYEKLHLFAPSGEKFYFAAGDKLVTYKIDGIKCATVICYDLRFPELIRKLALDDIAVLFVPAAWPQERLSHWQTLLRARAIENEIFVAAANGCGLIDESMHLAGHSAIIDPWGEILAHAEEDETIIRANCKIAIRSQIKDTIDVFADRRPELY